MNATQWITALKKGALDTRLLALYGKDALDAQRARYAEALRAFIQRFKDTREVEVFSVPGRSELGGNHTDHNHGCVIAAAVNVDILAIAAKNTDTTVRVLSQGFPEDTVDVSRFCAPREAEFGSSRALIAGVCAGLRHRGFAAGGFDAYTTSSVPKGSGLSSSAAFENMIGNIQNHLYNDGRIDNVEIAKISQYAENEFFGKPCGLMDQVASAVGGIVAMDFAKKDAPVIEKIHFDLSCAGYSLCILNTGGNHADLTPDYAAIPAEMRTVAAFFGKEHLREVTQEQLVERLPALRTHAGDRAVLRALHFLSENRRVNMQKAALQQGDLERFLQLVQESGLSSFRYLQNVYSPSNPAEQGISLALCLAEQFLVPRGGVCRVHGGGFAGTVQAYVKQADVTAYRKAMDAVFGEGACAPFFIRAQGATKI